MSVIDRTASAAVQHEPRPSAHPSQETLIHVLQAAAAAELAATGSARRRAYRTTRHLLAGAVRLGLSRRAIAAVLGVHVDTIRSRSLNDGLVTAPDFAALTGVPEGRIIGWEETGRIRQEGPDPAGSFGYRASALLAQLTLEEPSR